jgi:type IV pilus modification protein PilV
MEKGFTFIEVLISVFILSITLLGIAEITMVSLRNTKEAYWQSIAVIQLANVAERLRADPTAINYECDLWRQENQYLLPEIHENCSCYKSSCDIQLMWKQHQLNLEILL